MFLGKCPDNRYRTAEVGAAAGTDQGAFGFFQFPYNLVDLFGMPFHRRFVRAHGNGFRIFEFTDLLVLYINGEVDKHRPLPPAVGNIKCFFHNAGHIFRLPYDVTVFYKRFAGAGNIRFLEYVTAHKAAVHLAGDDHQRDTVGVSRSDAGDYIGSTGAAGNRYHANFSRQTGITAGRMGGMLFVADQYCFDICIQDAVIKRTDSNPRIPEYVFHLFHLKTLYNCVCSVHVLFLPHFNSDFANEKNCENHSGL